MRDTPATCAGMTVISNEDGKRVTAAGYVAADRVDRADDLPDLQSGLNFARELLRLLPFGELADVVRGGFEGVAKIRRDRGKGGREFFFG